MVQQVLVMFDWGVAAIVMTRPWTASQDQDQARGGGHR